MNLPTSILAILTAFSVIFIIAPAQAAPQMIAPGTVWRDTQGDIIQAHGGCVIKVAGEYYWFGEDKTHGSPYQDIPCYASVDLAHWTFRGYALTQQTEGDLGPHRVVERPKVLFNSRTQTYVMYLHIDSPNYGDAKVGVATSPNAMGPYTYRGSFRPLGHQSRDMTLFQDADGAGYLIFEDRERGVSIAKLSPDYLTVEKEVALVPKHYEAPAVIKVKGIYYLLGSHLTGWNTNANEYATASSLAGPWSDFKNVAPPETKTYNSQTAWILPVVGTKATSYIYLGDRWKPNDLSDSRYIWLPLTIRDGVMMLAPDQPWTIDAATGIHADGVPL